MKKIMIFLCLLILVLPICISPNLQTDGEQIAAEDYILLSLDVSNAPVQAIQFSVSNQLFDKCNASASEKTQFIDSLLEKVDMIRTEFLLNLTLKYLQNPIPQYKINDGVILSSVVYNSELSLVGFRIIYQSRAAFNYYNSSSSKSEKPADNGNIFIKKYTTNSLFPFCSEVNMGGGQKITVGERYKNFFTSAATGKDYYQDLCDFYSPTYVYDYVVRGDDLHSDAKYIVKDGNCNHHIWLVSENDLQNKPNISLSITIINKGWWFLMALLLALGALLICLIVIYRSQIKTFCIKIASKIRKNARSK